MSWKHIINPWGRNLDLERELAVANQRALQSDKVLVRQLQVNCELAEDLRMQKAVNAAAEQTNLRLHRLVANGHFRNPATGRLGPKGETYNL